MKNEKMMNEKVSNKKVILCFGGRGGEAKVSVASAQNLAQCYPFSSLWFLNEADEAFEVSLEELSGHQNSFTTPFSPRRAAEGFFWDMVKLHKDAVFFLGFHGSEGENGTFQKYFEDLGVNFTGSGATASALCFDKAAAKRVVAQAGLKIMESISIQCTSTQAFCQAVQEFFNTHGPLVVKPLAGGSSVGLFFIHRQEQIQGLDRFLSEFSGEVFLLEKFCSGREFTVGVVDEDLGKPVALVASEVKLTKSPDVGFDYQAKYLGQGAQEITPAQVTPLEMEKLKAASVKAHLILGCYGYSRSDFIMSADGDLYFLETNTLPGMTKMSFIPQQLNYCGISMPQFIESQILLAQRRPK